MNEELERVVSKELDALGFELVELRRGGTKNRPLIEIRIDRRDGELVTIDDCARASRALEAHLDGGTLVSEQYVLQVSSPGERPLKTAADWRRFVGQWASLSSPDHGGRMEGRIVSVTGEAGEEIVVVQPKKGAAREVPLAAIREARLAFQL